MFLKKSINEKTAYETLYENYEKDLKSAKQLRKQLSEELQQWLFSKFQMLNAEGESKDLLEIFKDSEDESRALEMFGNAVGPDAKDKLVFDVSHQCYPHKVLTGRAAGFLAPCISLFLCFFYLCLIVCDNFLALLLYSIISTLLAKLLFFNNTFADFPV